MKQAELKGKFCRLKSILKGVEFLIVVGTARLRLLHCTFNNSTTPIKRLFGTFSIFLRNCCHRVVGQLFLKEVLENMSHTPAASEDVISSFKKLLDTDVAVPVAAMNSLVCY